MFLKLLGARITDRTSTMRHDPERGVALPSAIGIMVVILIIAGVVLSASVSAAGFSTSTRAAVESRAAAGAGIEAVRAKLLGGNFVCTLSGTQPTFTARVEYTTEAGVALPCTAGVLTGTPGAARILSEGTATAKGVAGVNGEDKASVGADVDLVITPGGVTLNQAIFTEGKLVLTNNTEVNSSVAGGLDGNVYSNGAIDCHTQNVIQGTIYARGGLMIANTCQALGTVWVDGDVDLTASAVNLAGSVFATGKANLGVGHVGGNVIANGDVTMTTTSTTACPAGGSGNVCGSIYSLNGAVLFGGNQPVVKGSVYARKDVALGNQAMSPAQNVVSLLGKLTGGSSASIGGYAKVAQTNTLPNIPASKTNWCSSSTGFSACTPADLILPLPTGAAPSFAVELPMFSPQNAVNLGTPTAITRVVAPVRQGMPKILSSPAALLANWTGWVQPNISGSSCSFSNQSFSALVNPIIASHPTGTKILFNFKHCANAIQMSGETLKLKGDLALMAPQGFTSGNDLKVTSIAGTNHQFMMIAPSDHVSVGWSTADSTNYPGQVTPQCPSSPQAPDIRIDKLVPDGGIKVFIYSPCNVTIQNGGTFAGQIYSGTGSYPAGIKITRAIMSVPGVEIPGGASSSASYRADVLSRYDVSR